MWRQSDKAGIFRTGPGGTAAEVGLKLAPSPAAGEVKLEGRGGKSDKAGTFRKKLGSGSPDTRSVKPTGDRKGLAWVRHDSDAAGASIGEPG